MAAPEKMSTRSRSSPVRPTPAPVSSSKKLPTSPKKVPSASKKPKPVSTDSFYERPNTRRFSLVATASDSDDTPDNDLVLVSIPTIAPRRRSLPLTIVEAIFQTAAAGDSTAGSSSNETSGAGQSSEAVPVASGSGTTTATNGTVAGGAVGGDTGGKDDEDENNRRQSFLGSAGVIDADAEMEDGTEEKDEGTPVDTDDTEAALLLLMFNGRPESPVSSSSTPLVATSTSALPYGPTPGATPPIAPQTSSSGDSVGSIETPLEPSLVLLAVKDEPPTSFNPRSTRRVSHLLPSPKVVPAKSAALPPRLTTPRDKSLPRSSSSPKSARSSPRPADSPSSADSRGTRSSRPLNESLRELLSSPAVGGVSGGWDPKRRRYFSPGDGRRPAASPSPEAAAEDDPSSSSDVRSTRKTRPIEGDVRSLLASPAVSAVSGGWDAAAGKYTSSRRPRGGSADGSGGDSPGPSGSSARIKSVLGRVVAQED